MTFTQGSRLPEISEISQLSWNCPEISNCPEILLIWSEWPDMDLCYAVTTLFTSHDYVYVADVECQVMFSLVTLYCFMCNIALVTFLGLQYWSAPVINIYEHRKTCIFCVVSLVKLTKVSWNCLEIFQKFGPEISLLAARSPAFTGYCMHFSLWLHQGPQTSPDM